MQKLSLIILWLLFTLNLVAQKDYKQTIRGTVIDKYTQMPLIGATVILLESEPLNGTATDEQGNFRLEHIPVGRQGIKVSYIGYYPMSINNLLLSSGKELVLNIELEERVFVSKEVVIKFHHKKNKPINEMAVISARSFTVEETERYAGSWGDPARMVANFAGVMSVSDQQNEIIIRGNSPTGLLWRLDGIDIPNPNHFGSTGTTGGPVCMLNNNLLTNSDFFTGAFPAEYGNVLAGVFDLKMRTGNNEKREYMSQIGFNGFELGAEGPFSNKNKSSYLVNIRYATLEGFEALGMDIGTGSSMPQFKDISFKIDIPGTKYGRFSLFGLGGKSFIQLHDSKKDSTEWSYGLSGTDTDYGTDMGVTGLSHLFFFNEKTRLKTNLSVSGWRNHVKIDSISKSGNSPLPIYRSNIVEIKHTFSTHLRKKINPTNNVGAGMSYDVYHINYLDSSSNNGGKTFFVNTDSKGSFGLLQAYIQWQYKFSDQILFYSGLFSQLFLLNKDFVFEPRLGLKWNFSENQTISFGFGKHSQLQPRMSYFYQTLVDTLNNTYIQTNRNVELSKGNHIVLGYDYLFNGNLRLKLETYYQHLYNIPVLESRPEFSMLNAGEFFDLPTEDSLISTGTGKNYGLEITFERFFYKNYYFLITASFYQSKYKGYDGIERNTAFNGNFVFNCLGGYEFKIGKYNALAINLKGVWAGGKRRLPISLEESVSNGWTTFDWEHAYNERFRDYLRIDARFSFKLNRKKVNHEWALDIQNITNHKNIFMEGYDPVRQRIKYDYQFGFFPMIFYRIQF